MKKINQLGEIEFDSEEGVGGRGWLRPVHREDVSDKWRLRSAGSGSKLGSIWKVSSPALGAGVSGWPVPYGVWENKKATVAATQ